MALKRYGMNELEGYDFAVHMGISTAVRHLFLLRSVSFSGFGIARHRLSYTRRSCSGRRLPDQSLKESAQVPLQHCTTV